MFWCGNSPDLNIIETAWPHLKRIITKKGAPGSREAAEKAWDDLEQERIQAWIRRIMRHVKQVIHLEGGNEYREGEFYMDDEKPRTRGLRGAADTFSAKRRTLLVATSIQLLTFSSNPCLELQQKGTYLATI